MKKLAIITAIAASLVSNIATATTGGKVRPPESQARASIFTTGGKVRPPQNLIVVNTTGGKVRPPLNETGIDTTGGKVRPPQNETGIDTTGGKVRPPQSTNIVAQDSGTFSLSDIFSKYFSF